MDAKEKRYEELCNELTARGLAFNRPDVYGFLSACWPTESDAAELADDWEAAQD